MKQLLVLRHAKSDWNAGARDDHARPLNARGEAAAEQLGVFLARANHLPDAVVTSTARRAADTVARAVRAGEWECPVEEDDRLYEASVTDVLAVVAGCSTRRDRLLIAGHEPTSSDLLTYLTGASVRFPTAALAAIDLPVQDWNELDPRYDNAGLGQLRWFVIPKLIGGVL